MPFEVKILADSINSSGNRLTTVEASYPRIIHSEVKTHRMLSVNSASSRAIPVQKLIDRIEADPFIPEYIGKNIPGMKAGDGLTSLDLNEARHWWNESRRQAIKSAQELIKIGVHKQVANRLLEPFMYITVIMSATEWNNFFALRDHEDADPHFQKLARLIRTVRENSIPQKLKAGEWHLPLITEEDIKQLKDITLLKKISTARCCRVSYLNHNGTRDVQKDIDLHDQLLVQSPAHASPSEHPAQALGKPERIGNFIGWKQYRKFQANEYIPG